MDGLLINIGRLRLSGWESWSDVFDREHQNWIDIEVVRLHFEKAYYKQRVEMNLSLLGFNLCVEWRYGSKETPIKEFR